MLIGLLQTSGEISFYKMINFYNFKEKETKVNFIFSGKT